MRATAYESPRPAWSASMSSRLEIAVEVELRIRPVRRRTRDKTRKDPRALYRKYGRSLRFTRACARHRVTRAARRYLALGVLSLSGMLDSAITRANGVDADAFCRAFLLPRAVASATVPAPAMRGGDGQRLNSLRFAHRRHHAPLSWCDAHAPMTASTELLLLLR